MADALATLAGLPVLAARVSLPAWGVWYAEVTLDGEHTLTGAQSLVVADLTLRGTVISGGPQSGRSHYRIAGGGGGWGRTIPAWSRQDDGGVKASWILQDAAGRAGEVLGASLPSTRVAASWVRPAGPACAELERLFPSGWYVDADGVTQIGARPASNLADASTDGPVDGAAGVVVLARDSIAPIVPGVTVRGLVAVDVEHTISREAGLRSRVWGRLVASDADRRLSALRKLHEQLDPLRPFRGVAEFRVVSLESKRANLAPVRSSTGLPQLLRCVTYPGVGGAETQPAIGSRVLVGFVDSDPSRPAILGFEDYEGSGFVPVKVTLNASTFVDVGGSGAATLAKSAPATTALNAIGTWIAACTAALAANPTYTLFQAAMVTPGATVAAALTAAVALLPTSTARGK